MENENDNQRGALVSVICAIGTIAGVHIAPEHASALATIGAAVLTWLPSAAHLFKR